MPIFNYLCSNNRCKWEGEILMFFRTDYVDCPKCGKVAERQFTPGANFQLKGCGWERDGYTSKADYDRENVASEKAIEKEKAQRGIK